MPARRQAVVFMRRHLWSVAMGALLLSWLALLSAAAQDPNRSAQASGRVSTAPGGPTSAQANTRNPHGAINIPCQSCHTYTSWKPIRQAPDFDHSKTSYPLQGVHRNVACADCHTNLVFSQASTRCADCHADIHRGQLGSSCDRCHTVSGWSVSQQAVQNHQNRFPLVLAHAVVECAACHKGAAAGTFRGLSTQCYSCHNRDFQSATVPNHVTGRFSTSCEQCHSIASWEGAAFDHSQTGFTLSGAHSGVACASCHVNGNFSLSAANATCASCHMPDYLSTKNPSHSAGRFPTTCEQCHNTNTWVTATFDHSQTGFALAGAHLTIDCVACHVNSNYTLTSANTTCASCHMKDYTGATNPNHQTGHMSTSCEQCHNSTAWTSAAFNHAQTGFALTGAHGTTACASCHVNNNFNLTAANAACSACHMTDYRATTNPNHQASAFPTDCSVCHSTTNWQGAVFNHAATGWALVGTHATTACTACHVSNNYNLTAANTACVSCHQSSYTTALSPVNHVQLGFPTSCELCHDSVAWTNGKFNHSTTAFALTGAHTTVACASCHVNNNYTTLPTDCYSCHKSDYQSTSNPNHSAAGFPTSCLTCHTTTTWAGATFNHTWFPTNHGNARAVCATCHTNSSDYSVFQCTSCHTASQTNSHHSGVSGYVYNSASCYRCHPNGRN